MHIPSNKSTKQELLIYMALVYTFGVLVRLMVLQNVWGVESLWYEGRILPIWSDDAGLYGYYAKQILGGMSFPLEGDYLLSYLIASIVQVTGVHIDWVMLLLPAFLAPLVSLPILILGHKLQILKFAFYASLIGVIGINYYTRSYLGYLDTDTINLFLSYLLVVGMVIVSTSKDLRYAVISIVALVLLAHFYHSAKSLIAGILAINLLMVVLFYTKNHRLYQLLLLLFIAFVLALKVHFLLALIVPTALIWLLRHPMMEAIDYRYYLGLFALGIVGVLGFANMGSIYARAIDYFTLNSLVSVGEYRISNVLATVGENQQRGIFDIFNNFVGIGIYVVVALVGFGLLVKHKREFIFFIPLLLLGLLSFKIGIRFTMYAELVLAMGFVSLLYLLKKEDLIHIGVALGMVVMAFNILRVNSFIKPKYFYASDLKLLHTLKIKSNDRVISWWDYGWPLWYYLGSKNTYIDNGNNTDGGTLFVAKMLLASTPQKAYNLGKLIAHNRRDLKILKSDETMEKAANALSIANKNVYVLLHRNMLGTFPTLASFADRNIQSGKLDKKRTFAISAINQSYSKTNRWIKGKYFRINIDNGIVADGQNMTQLYGMIEIQNGKIKLSQTYNKQSRYVVVVYGKQALYMDRESFHTLLVQALVLHRIEDDLFSQVGQSRNLSILKLN